MRRFWFLAWRRVRRAAARLRAWRQRSSLAAVAVSSLPSGSTVTGGTLRIVAHQDDDLLFQSLSLQADAEGRSPMTTVYLTAGDDDDEEWYWRAREAGVRAAYAAMLGVGDVWLDEVRSLGGVDVAQATLAAAPRVRLVFVRLPDGGIEGHGGSRSGGASLRKLWEGAQATITCVDGSATHTLASLTALLGELVAETAPRRILTLDHVGEFGDGDHSDHHVAAYLAEQVHAGLEASGGPSFTGYRGYTIERFPANLSAEQIAAKEAAFFAYAVSDYKTCSSIRTCSVRPESLWLAREYEVSRVTA
ncbi:PIG-L family deacetylase [Frondihabitans australicus]|uniref:GlcNAc-PI de-N-acetylase n=1 Tax=Frondihabitans australicus TaxID=386892 RepID=A0A495INI4_9MICO|nr:PIG-L family deacetylase [Frondihabitans australicus]RKR76685.1 GlcNAc-PI de-N-acetylase [Frondihabitans australicus]